MTVDQMRCALAEVYPGPKWRLKCQTMPERQVVAIYKSLSEKDKLHKKSRKAKRKEPGISKAIQITIFDLDPTLIFSIK